MCDVDSIIAHRWFGYEPVKTVALNVSALSGLLLRHQRHQRAISLVQVACQQPPVTATAVTTDSSRLDAHIVSTLHQCILEPHRPQSLDLIQLAALQYPQQIDPFLAKLPQPLLPPLVLPPSAAAKILSIDSLLRWVSRCSVSDALKSQQSQSALSASLLEFLDQSRREVSNESWTPQLHQITTLINGCTAAHRCLQERLSSAPIPTTDSTPAEPSPHAIEAFSLLSSLQTMLTAVPPSSAQRPTAPESPSSPLEQYHVPFGSVTAAVNLCLVLCVERSPKLGQFLQKVRYLSLFRRFTHLLKSEQTRELLVRYLPEDDPKAFDAELTLLDDLTTNSELLINALHELHQSNPQWVCCGFVCHRILTSLCVFLFCVPFFIRKTVYHRWNPMASLPQRSM